MTKGKRKRKRSERTLYHIYVLLINSVVIDVGQSYQTPAQRQGIHRGHFKQWLNGYVGPNGKKQSTLGFYDAMKHHLDGRDWSLAAETELGISWNILERREMTGHEADRLEDHYIKKYPTTLNKIPGGIGGKGKTRQVTGGKLTATYGSIAYDKRAKKYRVRNATVGGKNPSLGRYKTIEDAYAVLLAAYDKVKDDTFWKDIAPKPLSEYQLHLFSKYNLTK